MREEIYDKVLDATGTSEDITDFTRLNSWTAKLAPEAFGEGESDHYRRFKEFVAANPSIIGFRPKRLAVKLSMVCCHHNHANATRPQQS